MKKIKTMDLILIIIGLSVFCFIGIMLYFFNKYQAIPDTLVVSFFGAIFGQLSIMGMIQRAKKKVSQMANNEVVDTLISEDDSELKESEEVEKC